jgi:hypothetical protein
LLPSVVQGVKQVWLAYARAGRTRLAGGAGLRMVRSAGRLSKTGKGIVKQSTSNVGSEVLSRDRLGFDRESGPGMTTLARSPSTPAIWQGQLTARLSIRTSFVNNGNWPARQQYRAHDVQKCSSDDAFRRESDSATERDFFLGNCADCGSSHRMPEDHYAGCSWRAQAELDLAEDFAERVPTIGQMIAGEFLRQHGDQLPEDDRGS